MKPKVRFENVSKNYSLYSKRSDKLMEMFFNKKRNDSFYALTDLSFEVYEGETIGIVGINGSGKSTLSNLLAQVIPPTSGTIEMNGDPSLIAISAGLNNHLSGLENIEMKCLMHGLSKREIEELTPVIEDFADIGTFIKQPVKNYSSGMKARLGFAISVHTNPDILVVDEALSVGDQTFYQKCMEKINEFKKQGKTIFFISHSLSQMKSISDRIMWIHFGEIKDFGEANEIIGKYKGFIDWFNSLSKEEKNAYKKEMVRGQSRGPNRHRTRLNKKKKTKISLFFQVFLLSILLIGFGSLLFLNTYGTSAAELLNRFKDEVVATDDKDFASRSETVNSSQNEAVVPESKVEHVNQPGFVREKNIEAFRTEDMVEVVDTLKFADRVFIEERINDTFKVRLDNDTVYVKGGNVKVGGNNPSTMAKAEDFIPVYPKSVEAAYQYYLTFLNAKEEKIKDSLKNLTNEAVLNNGKKDLVYGYDNVVYHLNTEGTSESLTVKNLKPDVEKYSSIKQLATVSSKDQQVFYVEGASYDFLFDLNEKTVKIKSKKQNTNRVVQ
ncbi:teichoic acids export ABC transporter ATP-binding subunit TagH [Pseudalkalibacillus caeni]|uniref:Teichoic acids export ABC transporter ATP-binding subunit TagH n=1 Tax=Exobacillus caeni TaxID=2574798 RepID=A0A5R9F6M3_9BACL|nr:teichoic acids export ABC transporter ATP-binding subunit TagH [Pseudalkalibacillus caeni]TLS38681.1 teichoic acids export ABC transporter ATP-binding subunit TagH [Pseudalkalibacillus caeni]